MRVRRKLGSRGGLLTKGVSDRRVMGKQGSFLDGLLKNCCRVQSTGPIVTNRTSAPNMLKYCTVVCDATVVHCGVNLKLQIDIHNIKGVRIDFTCGHLDDTC